jgi:hypothetical protein
MEKNHWKEIKSCGTAVENLPEKRQKKVAKKIKKVVDIIHCI